MSEEQKETKKETVAAAAVVEFNKDAAMQFTNHMELSTNAKMMIQLNLAPDHLKKDGFTAVAAAMIMCRQFNLPDTAMNEMAFVKGKLTTFGSLVTALAERHPDYGEMESFFVDKDCNKICSDNKNLNAAPWSHVRKVKKKNGTVWNEYTFSVEDAFQAGLLTEKTSKDSGWFKYTKDMLSHKTKARAYRENYASALHGVQYHEDIVEALYKERDVTNAASATTIKNKVNDFLNADEPQQQGDNNDRNNERDAEQIDQANGSAN